MIGSRLQIRRNQITLAIYSRSHSNVTYSETLQTTQTATHEQKTVTTTDDLQGTYNEIMDIFWIEALAGNDLPAINPGWVAVDTSDNTRYEIRNANQVGGEQDRLKLETKRLNWPI